MSVFGAGNEMPASCEVVVDGGVDGEEALS
jgi:hypothetical protein